MYLDEIYKLMDNEQRVVIFGEKNEKLFDGYNSDIPETLFDNCVNWIETASSTHALLIYIDWGTYYEEIFSIKDKTK